MGSSVSTDQPNKPKTQPRNNLQNHNNQSKPKNGQRVSRPAQQNNRQIVRYPQGGSMGIPRPMVVHGGLPVGNYVVVRVPVIYAPQALYYVQQSPVLSPNHVYVSPASEYYAPVPVSQIPPISVPHQPLVVPHQSHLLVNNTPVSHPSVVIKNNNCNIQTPIVPTAPPAEKEEASKIDKTTENSSSETDDSSSYETDDENSPDIILNKNQNTKQNESQNIKDQASDDMAFAIQLEGILSLEEQEGLGAFGAGLGEFGAGSGDFGGSTIPKYSPYSFEAFAHQYTMDDLALPQAAASGKNGAMLDEVLSVDEIIHLYKSGEPVDDHINIYIALNPEKLVDFEKLLESEVSSQSILQNVHQFYKERDPYPTIDDDFIVDYLTPSDDEAQENCACDE